MPLLFYINSITALFPCICPMSDETRQNKSKQDKTGHFIKWLIFATILQLDNLKILYLCPFPAIIHYSISSHDTLYWLYIVLYGLNIVVGFHSFYVILFFLKVFATKLQPQKEVKSQFLFYHQKTFSK